MEFLSEVHNFEADVDEEGNAKETCVHCGNLFLTTSHPHAFTIDRNPKTCACALPERALIHQMTSV